MTAAATPILTSFALPGDAVFPESIGIDGESGAAYAGSLADGTIYRIAPSGEVAIASPAGADGRESVAGVKIDARGRLWAAGGYAGTLHVYELEPWSLVSRHQVPARPSCVNDIAFGPDGRAYVTDSLIPTLFRADADADAPRLEAFADLAQQRVPWPDGLNFNGIVLAPDRRHLVACQTNTGRFWRIALQDGGVDEVAVDGGPLEHCDGLALDGSALYVAVNALNHIAVVELAADASTGAARHIIHSDGFRFPTAVAVQGDRLLVVNGQLDRMESEPELPFTVVAIARPSTPPETT